MEVWRGIHHAAALNSKLCTMNVKDRETMLSLSELRRFYRGSMELGTSLAPYAALGIGGPTDYFFVPASADDALVLVRQLRLHGIPFIEVAQGSNILVSDDGFRGAAISLEEGCSEIRIREHEGKTWLIEAGAGVRFSKLLDFCIEHGVTGTEYFAGLLGTIGEWLTDNGIAATPLHNRLVVEARAIHEGLLISISGLESQSLPKSQTEPPVFLSAIVQLEEGCERRSVRVQYEMPGQTTPALNRAVPAGPAVFRDPEGASAVDLLRASGCAGMRVGEAMVSIEEPNCIEILNREDAKPKDVLELVRAMQRTVRACSGYHLPLSIRLIGFQELRVLEVA